MNLFLVRHATAIEPLGGLPDAERSLTPEGRERFEQAVSGLSRSIPRLDRVYHSPWLRALQTAECLEPLLDGERICLNELAAPPSAALLAKIKGESVALVGHEPWMGDLLTLLVLGENRHRDRFHFKKGQVAWLVGDPHPACCDLRAFFTPKVLRNASR